MTNDPNDLEKYSRISPTNPSISPRVPDEYNLAKFIYDNGEYSQLVDWWCSVCGFNWKSFSKKEDAINHIHKEHGQGAIFPKLNQLGNWVAKDVNALGFNPEIIKGIEGVLIQIPESKRDKYRMVWEMRLNKYTWEDIAEKCDIAVNTAKEYFRDIQKLISD